MPMQLPGSRVKLVVEDSDLMDIEISARFVATLSEPTAEELAQEMES